MPALIFLTGHSWTINCSSDKKMTLLSDKTMTLLSDKTMTLLSDIRRTATDEVYNTDTRYLYTCVRDPWRFRNHTHPLRSPFSTEHDGDDRLAPRTRGSQGRRQFLIRSIMTMYRTGAVSPDPSETERALRLPIHGVTNPASSSAQTILIRTKSQLVDI